MNQPEKEGVSYDAVPYTSYVYPASHPNHLAAVARIFGMETPDFRSAKVLEIGCASGGNILPIAARYPESRFVGIDLSERQIEVGKQRAEALGLKNLKLVGRSISDLVGSRNRFDYIIAHGIYSWVSDEVQEELVKVCGKLLSENGVAYISYNTLPGWSMVKSLREMMLYHVRNIEDVQEKLNQALLLLKFIKEGAPAANSPYVEVIQQELNLLNGKKADYFLHDHLEEHNTPCYLHEFMTRATQHGLQFLGESSVGTMFVGNLSQQVAETLSKSKDIVVTEQYLDYLTNRRFRMTLLCRQGVALTRDLNGSVLDGLSLSSHVKPEKPVGELDLSQDANVSFVGGQSLSSRDRFTTAALIYLAECGGRYVAIERIVERVMEMTGEEDRERVEPALRGNLLRLLLANVLNVCADETSSFDELSEKPTAYLLARELAKSMDSVTSVSDTTLNLDLLQRLLIQLLDGTRDRAALEEFIVENTLGGKLNLNEDGKAVTDEARVRELVSLKVNEGLELFRQNNLLVA